VPHFAWDPIFECGITLGLVITCTSTCLGRECMVCTTGQCGRIGAMESIFDFSINAPNALLARIQSMTLPAPVVQEAVALSGTMGLPYHIREIIVPICTYRTGNFKFLSVAKNIVERSESCALSDSPTRCMLKSRLPLGHQLTELMGLLTTPHMYRLII
jgi:hypothetical protein